MPRKAAAAVLLQKSHSRAIRMQVDDSAAAAARDFQHFLPIFGRKMLLPARA